jgi:hypothetical protein
MIQGQGAAVLAMTATAFRPGVAQSGQHVAFATDQQPIHDPRVERIHVMHLSAEPVEPFKVIR